MIVPKGVPTLARLHKHLAPHAAEYGGLGESPGYLLRREGYGHYSVSWAGGEGGEDGADREHLARFLAALRFEYDVEPEQTGPDSGKLHVGPRQGISAHLPPIRSPFLSVSFALVREDIWQALTTGPTYLGVTMNDFLNDVRTFARAIRETGPGAVPYYRDSFAWTGPASQVYSHDTVDRAVGLATHFHRLCLSTPEAEEEGLLRVAAETALLWRGFLSARRLWPPSSAVAARGSGQRLVEFDYLDRIHRVAGARRDAEVKVRVQP